jgi:hypothetical protein
LYGLTELLASGKTEFLTVFAITGAAADPGAAVSINAGVVNNVV